jgi:hypothetical protein
MELKYILIIFGCMILFCYTSFKPNIEYFKQCKPTKVNISNTQQKPKNPAWGASSKQIYQLNAESKANSKIHEAGAKGGCAADINIHESEKDQPSSHLEKAKHMRHSEKEHSTKNQLNALK